MEKLLELPSDFWCKILDLDDISLYPADTPGTPDTPSRAGGWQKMGLLVLQLQWIVFQHCLPELCHPQEGKEVVGSGKYFICWQQYIYCGEVDEASSLSGWFSDTTYY